MTVNLHIKKLSPPGGPGDTWVPAHQHRDVFPQSKGLLGAAPMSSFSPSAAGSSRNAAQLAAWGAAAGALSSATGTPMPVVELATVAARAARNAVLDAAAHTGVARAELRTAADDALELAFIQSGQAGLRQLLDHVHRQKVDDESAAQQQWAAQRDAAGQSHIDANGNSQSERIISSAISIDEMSHLPDQRAAHAISSLDDQIIETLREASMGTYGADAPSPWDDVLAQGGDRALRAIKVRLEERERDHERMRAPTEPRYMGFGERLERLSVFERLQVTSAPPPPNPWMSLPKPTPRSPHTGLLPLPPIPYPPTPPHPTPPPPPGTARVRSKTHANLHPVRGRHGARHARGGGDRRHLKDRWRRQRGRPLDRSDRSHLRF